MNVPKVPSFVPGQTITALFSRVLQKNSAWSFDNIFWLLIFTGRDTSWPSRHSCWSGKYWSHWRNFSGIPFVFGGICVPVSNSLYWKTCVPKRCRTEEGIMKPIQLSELVCLLYDLILFKYGLDWCINAHKKLPSALGKHSSGKSSTLFFVKLNNAWNAFKKIIRENEISQ